MRARLLGSLLPTRRPSFVLATILAIAGFVVSQLGSEIGEPRRWVLALSVIGLLAAPALEVRLRVPVWIAAGGLFAWLGRLFSEQAAPAWAWLLLAVGAAALVVRGGERLCHYVLPGANDDEGRSLRWSIRRELLLSAAIFCAVYVAEGVVPAWPAWPGLRVALLFLSGALFVRYLLLQSKYLGVTAVPLFSQPESSGFVASQRWPYLILASIVGLTPVPDRLLGTTEEDHRVILLTSTMLFAFAAGIFIASLLRGQRNRKWSRRTVRAASFAAGLFLAVGLYAVLVQLNAGRVPVVEAPIRADAVTGLQSVFVLFSTFFLIVLPFAKARTRLVGDGSFSFFVGPSVLAVMNAPMTVVNGDRWPLASTWFLLSVTFLIVTYHIVVAWRAKAAGRAYLVAVAAVLIVGSFWGQSHVVYKTLLISTGLAFYAFDLFDRSRGKRVLHS